MIVGGGGGEDRSAKAAVVKGVVVKEELVKTIGAKVLESTCVVVTPNSSFNPLPFSLGNSMCVKATGTFVAYIAAQP